MLYKIDHRLKKTSVLFQVTIPFSASILTNTYPVESSEFHPGIMDTIRAIVPTLQESKLKIFLRVPTDGH